MSRYTDYDLYEEFDNMLDDTHEEIILNGLSYMPSEVLKAVDASGYTRAYERFIDDYMEEQWERQNGGYD